MMLTRVMFRPIISQICARSPLYLKLFLSIFILQPMKTYVHWFRCFQMDVPIDHHICGRNFRQCGCWWLWISHILQGFVYWHCIFGIDENCSQLGFGRQLHYRSYDLIFNTSSQTYRSTIHILSLILIYNGNINQLLSQFFDSMRK